MTRKIYKYQFPMLDKFSIDMPEGAEVLTVQMQNGTPCIWALVNLDAIVETRAFRCYGTGHPVPEMMHEKLDYIGTFQLHGGQLIFHLFEV